MRKFVLAAVAVLAFSTAARAALILHVEDVVINQSSSAQTGFIEVYLEETGPTNEAISSYNVGVRLAPTGVVTFTGLSASVDHPSLFLGQAPTDRTANAAGYNPANDRLATDDFLINGVNANAPVQNGTRDGLFRIGFSVPADAVGTFAVTVDPLQFELADAEANPVVALIENGSITVVPVPEPSALALGLVALPLLARRRR